jgi:hypothetical protein
MLCYIMFCVLIMAMRWWFSSDVNHIIYIVLFVVSFLLSIIKSWNTIQTIGKLLRSQNVTVLYVL